MAKPRTVRVIEIAELLGVSHQRASKIVPLRSGIRVRAVYGREVQAWAKMWRREKPWR